MCGKYSYLLEQEGATLDDPYATTDQLEASEANMEYEETEELVDAAAAGPSESLELVKTEPPPSPEKMPPVIVSQTKMSKKAKANLAALAATPKRMEMHSCTVCPRKFARHIHLQEHMSKHAAMEWFAREKFICHICGHASKDKRAHDNHLFVRMMMMRDKDLDRDQD